MKRTLASGLPLLAVALGLPALAAGQTTFRSTQSANLATARMLNGGNWLFEISHRFTPISQGAEAFWGLDGPVLNRLGLTFAPHDRLMLGVLRTNGSDNVELNTRFRGFAIGGAVPIEVGAQGGIAWNTADVGTTPPVGLEDNEMQVYVQIIANALVAERVALGVVPTLLRNPRILDRDSETGVAVGVNGQVYLNGTWSFLAEWIFSEVRAGQAFDSGTFGFEIRTRGHFFKLLVTNQQRMNPTQFLGGSAVDFWDADNLRFGFNIQRLLPF